MDIVRRRAGKTALLRLINITLLSRGEIRVVVAGIVCDVVVFSTQELPCLRDHSSTKLSIELRQE